MTSTTKTYIGAFWVGVGIMGLCFMLGAPLVLTAHKHNTQIRAQSDAMFTSSQLKARKAEAQYYFRRYRGN